MPTDVVAARVVVDGALEDEKVVVSVTIMLGPLFTVDVASTTAVVLVVAAVAAVVVGLVVV